MTDEIRNKINEIASKDLDEIDAMTPGSEERTIAVKNLETLLKLESYDYEVATKAYKDEALIRTEKQKIWVGLAGTGIACLVALATNVFAIGADRFGWFPSPLGMKTAIKPKLF